MKTTIKAVNRMRDMKDIVHRLDDDQLINRIHTVPLFSTDDEFIRLTHQMRTVAEHHLK